MKEEILKLRQSGKTYVEIVNELGCSKGIVSYYCGKKNCFKKVKSGFCNCGNKKDYDAIVCQKCRSMETLKRNENKTLSEIALDGNARIKWSYLRKQTHKKMEINNITKQCSLCDFDLVVELCHIKPISSFPETTLVKEVNSLDNMRYLCPNHHKMLDKGILKM